MSETFIKPLTKGQMRHWAEIQLPLRLNFAEREITVYFDGVGQVRGWVDSRSRVRGPGVKQMFGKWIESSGVKVGDPVTYKLDAKEERLELYRDGKV